MSITLTDIDLNVYTFPSTFTVRSLNLKKKAKQIDIAYKDGGDEIGDDKLNGRIIQIEGVISDNSTYSATMQTIYKWLNKVNLKLSIESGKYINVKVIGDIANDFYEGGFQRVSKLKFSCICSDPFFYSTSLTTSTTVISASPTSIVITNGCNFDILPLITIVNSVNNYSLKVENTTDDLNYFEYINGSFNNLETLVIDNDIGTVQEEGINSIQYFSGNFLRLLSGSNSLIYTGSNCSITIAYYERFL